MCWQVCRISNSFIFCTVSAFKRGCPRNTNRVSAHFLGDFFNDSMRDVGSSRISDVIASENTQGNPAAWASTPTTGNPSIIEGKHNTSNACNNSLISRRCPKKSTFPCKFLAATCFFICSSKTPHPTKTRQADSSRAVTSAKTSMRKE